MDEQEEHVESGGIALPPFVFGITTLVMNVALAAAAIGFAYLIFALFFGLGDFSNWDVARQKLTVGNLSLAGNVLMIGLGVASLCAAINFWFEDTAGVILLVGALVIGFGLPYAYIYFNAGTPSSRGVATALAAFPRATMVPIGIGGLLFVRDIFSRLARGVRQKVEDTAKMEFGTGAKRERPLRTSLLGKCWEGPYCREWVRTHCPIYQRRQACWRQKRGCYCEEDIVATAAQKVQGVVLEMAADSRYNFANPTAPGATPPRKAILSDGQKKERCRNCVIYNEHQSEKYKVIMPIVLVGTIALCVVLSPMMRGWISIAMSGVESIANRFAFQSGAHDQMIKLTRPNEIAQWALVGAMSLMLVSKVLQVVEWLVFVRKV